MKIQDIAFLIILAILIYRKDPRWSVYAGLGSLAMAIPLFATWTFFTAERLTWYSAAFFLLSVLLRIWNKR